MKRALVPMVSLVVFTWAGFAQGDTVKLQLKGAY